MMRSVPALAGYVECYERTDHYGTFMYARSEDGDWLVRERAGWRLLGGSVADHLDRLLEETRGENNDGA